MDTIITKSLSEKLIIDIVSPPPKDLKSDKNISKRAIFKRPFLDDFLRFCFQRFEVAIWSSRIRFYQH
ncbi:unnamed protein product [Lactuca virosa]|uniref:FCP1 homology domain-containing protein n=1 Tax=Lactuca virosa TaxID=75947 RepID=A0AAU9N6Z8_9ASTR|nr:unnamed protein product [Lactuca virosa]